MTTRELIKALMALDPEGDADVGVASSTGMMEEITSVDLFHGDVEITGR